MRTCASCGYLSLADNDACMHCGASMAATAPKPAEQLVTVGAPAPAPARRPAPPAPFAPAPRSTPDLGYTVRLGASTTQSPMQSPTPTSAQPGARSAPGSSRALRPIVAIVVLVAGLLG